MADWGRLIPLILLFVFLGILAFVGFVVYSIVMDVQTQTKDKMKVKNVNLSREGVKIAVEDVNAEAEADRSQSILVDVWNYGTALPSAPKQRWSAFRRQNGESKNDKKK